MTERKSASLRLLATLLSGVVLILAGLGVWQLQRLTWKLDLIARTEARLASDEAPAPPPEDWPYLAQEADEYLRVAVSGKYFGKDVLVKAVTDLGGGFWVMTPFESDAGWMVFVNRGFVPADPIVATYAPPPVDPVKVTGLLRMSQIGGGFLRSNDPKSGRWYSRDTMAMGQSSGLSEVAPYFIDSSASSSEPPLGGMTVVRFRNHHLQYALTWFAMAALLTGAIIWMLRRG